MGERPRIHPTQLPQNFAQKSINCYLKRGVFEPSKMPMDFGVQLLPATIDVFHYDRDANDGSGFWLQFDNNVSVVSSPIADDAYKRIYWVGDGAPKMTGLDVATAGVGPYPSVGYDLGIPVPNAFGATGPAGEPEAGQQPIEAAYVITFVSKYGEEGPPSLATGIITRWDGSESFITDIPVPSGNFIAEKKRLYRQEMQTGIWQLVAQLAPNVTEFTDSVNSDSLGTMMISESWLPPNQNMQGLIALPNGGLMGWWDETIAFSEPYQPHAWPIEYRHKLHHKVVGAGLSDIGILVATEGQPYVLVGTEPSSISETKMDTVAACVSGRSVVDLGGSVVFASTEGLIGSGGNITAEHITEDQWLALNPSSIHAYRWKGRYLGFYNNGKKGSFTFHPSEGFVFFDYHADNCYYDNLTGDVFLIQDNGLSLWFGGASDTGTWKSKDFESAFLNPPVAARVDAKLYPVTVNYYTDGQLTKTAQVANRRAFRLPNKSNIDVWSIEVIADTEISAIHIASSMSEI